MCAFTIFLKKLLKNYVFAGFPLTFLELFVILFHEEGVVGALDTRD